MRSIPAAMTWELLRRSRWQLFFALTAVVGVPALVVLAIRHSGKLPADDPSMVSMNFQVMLVGMLAFGTALMLSHGPLLQSLWQGDVIGESVANPGGGDSGLDGKGEGTTAQAANTLEILLDYVLSESSQHVGHLLNTHYEQLLSDDEKLLFAELNHLESVATKNPGMKSLPAWQPVQRMLEALGAKPEKPQS